MRDFRTRIYVQVLGLGFIAGMRSMEAPALVSTHLMQTHPRWLIGTPFSLLARPAVASAFSLLAAGEMAGDKVPGMPTRIAGPALAWRAVSGTIIGAALSVSNGLRSIPGALLGGAAAVAAAYGTFHLRRALRQRLGLPDALLGALEDALVIRGGHRLLELSSPTLH